MEEDIYLQHFGVKGMKWGQRKSARFVGTSSEGGKPKGKNASFVGRDRPAVKVYGAPPQGPSTYVDRTMRVTKARKLSDADLKARVERMQLEKKYSDLTKPQITQGKKMFQDLADLALKTLVKTATEKATASAADAFKTAYKTRKPAYKVPALNMPRKMIGR